MVYPSVIVVRKHLYIYIKPWLSQIIILEISIFQPLSYFILQLPVSVLLLLLHYMCKERWKPLWNKKCRQEASEIKTAKDGWNGN